MKTTARSILSATIAFGLTVYALISMFTPGVSAALAIGLLAIYALLEMAILSYAPRRTFARRASALRLVSSPVMVRVPALVEYSARATPARAA